MFLGSVVTSHHSNKKCVQQMTCSCRKHFLHLFKYTASRQLAPVSPSVHAENMICHTNVFLHLFKYTDSLSPPCPGLPYVFMQQT